MAKGVFCKNNYMAKKLKIRPLNAKQVSDQYLIDLLSGADSDKTIAKFCQFNSVYFNELASKHKLKERQRSSLIGFKDETFVKILITQIISELGLKERFYCCKVTSNEKCGLHARKIAGSDEILTIGGDCVVFQQNTNKPLLIIECKEYIDMIRLKELIGESRLIKDEINNSINLLKDIKFCVFANVLELTNGWAKLLQHSDLKYQIDRIFVIRAGKRKDKANNPVLDNLMQFRNYIREFLRDRVKNS